MERHIRTSDRLFFLGLLLSFASAATGQDDSRFPLIGRIRPRAARDISSSRWSVGAETLDHGFGVYASYKAYLGPLGAKSIRLQAGWARCEPRPGVYDWGWLDAVVDDALAQGVRPWLQLSYGNPVYSGGGDTGLGGGFPSSPEALAAWDRWVRAIVQHYGDRVHQ
jgi:beta-glucosidase/6-phospho-beta-glucosidase/beta-galactosidase